ncbi:hypothetical protein ASPZODRAFT_133478 [Penicilliopsis zonata CBS 506.65]|uniref:Uncharacterized protein n=1 Tax=Penicilliopsis zonata CBS 506.65 TaxID=1073090 RepID=A0A1L9SEP2_9EURO|nr:hypothetical protein ASPZODRAFT_133478 [Penicilliopsis zonata CBS 506.65]OJJ45622.1 hypothetical protein ASPZODRAFT_133478 [Penicilliopsis zonata CBS 506.65]
MHTLKATGASSLSLPEGSYIYALAPCSAGLAAISSDDSLRLIDSANLKQISVLSSQTHSGGVTCLRTGAGEQGTLLATGGRDGKVRLWDANRTAGATVEFEALKNAPVLSVACNAATNTVVAGTELVSSQAVVSFWDIRFPREPRLQYVESHNDDVTELEYHPTQNHILLSGSTDGLVNIYDTTIQDEDDALVQVINHGSVHHAGFLSPDTVYALSHDEVFSIHPMTNPDDPQKEPEPVLFGDLREPLACEYVVQLCPGGAGYLAVGNKMYSSLIFWFVCLPCSVC